MPTISVTGQTLVSTILTHLGLNEQGGTPSDSDANYVLGVINSTWNSWGIDEGLIYSVLTAQYALTGGLSAYPIGPEAAAPFNVTRPSRIYKAVIVVNAAGAKIRRQVKIVEEEVYFAHGDLAASGIAPEELYPDYNVDANGSMTLYLWPTPSAPVATLLELETGVPFAAWTLGGTYILPDGYYDALQWGAAYKSLPGFGAAVLPELVASVTQNAMKSEARIREMNVKNRQLPLPAAENPQTQQLPQAEQRTAQ